MHRIVIIGSGGSGKSTLARSLGEKLNLDVLHLDTFYWKANWRRPSKQKWLKTLQELVNRPRWIIDGNYMISLDIRLNAADTIIFLDFPRYVCLWRVLQRRIRYHGRTRADMSPGCRERLTFTFLSWIWNFPQNEREQILNKLKAHQKSKQIFILQTSNQVREFLKLVQSHKKQ
uniref:Putative nucleoside triphosphate hydrolase n=1 Tax=Prochloron didemni P3-Solomon TaxID=910458 RepID=G0XS77_PRODI|nr:putative nucleoside triphosphate hydrolase [Prochloron didemni P3-Solomon]